MYERKEKQEHAYAITTVCPLKHHISSSLDKLVIQNHIHIKARHTHTQQAKITGECLGCR